MDPGGAAQPPTAGSRRPSGPVLAVAATAALAVVAGSVVAVLLLGGRTPPGEVGEGSASPSAAASAAPSAAEASASGSALPYVPDASLLQVNVTGLRMRVAAGTAAEVLRTFDLGEVVRVVSGPLQADGYAWYEVVDLDSRTGWAAVGSETVPWLEPVPLDPATSELLLRLGRSCDADEHIDSPVFPADVALSADGRVVLISGVVRQLSSAGIAQVQRDVIAQPALQTGGTYQLEHRPGAPDAPGHGTCTNRFTLGEGATRVVVNATNWQGDEEEAAYWVDSPERRALDELALHLQDIEAWLGPAAWSDPFAHRYVSGSYQLWLEQHPGEPTPPETDAPPVIGAAWPFDGPIDQFGEPVGAARCGLLDLGQAFETLRLIRSYGVPTFAVGEDAPPELSLDGFGAGNFVTEAGWLSFWLTPRSPDGFPGCGAAS